MLTYAALPMTFKTIIATLLFITMSAGICTCIFVGGKQGRAKQILVPVCTVIAAVMLLLFASIIPAERAKPNIPSIVLWFTQLPVIPLLLVWLACAIFLVMVIAEEFKRRKNAITPSSIKESLDHLQTGLCFSQPNGLVLLTNHQMNTLSHTLFGLPLQNANLFWKALSDQETSAGAERIASGDQPEFRLADGTIWSFQKEALNVITQITAADTTRQHHLVQKLTEKNQELEAMNARIRSYGTKVDEYVAAREQLETRVNLHGFLGQALLMTRHYLQYESGDPKKIIDIWQRNIDVLRMEAQPQQESDSLGSLQNAAAAVGMQVTVNGRIPARIQLRKLIASMGAENLTNAVRHANAKQLWIDIEESETEYIIRYTNDGTVPSGTIREGGGLSNARRKVQAAGGRMKIDAAPRFMMTLFFGKEVMMDV